MLNNAPQVKLFCEYQLLVVSKDPGFQQRIRTLSRGNLEHKHYRYASRLPDPRTLDLNLFHALIIDVQQRPEQTLQWVSDSGR